MAKYVIGELVHFLDSEISVSATPCMSVTIKTDNLSGKVTGVVDCGKEETEYHVDVNMPANGVVLKAKVNESALLSNSEHVQKVIDDLMKKDKGIITKILRTDIMKGVDSAVPGGDKNGVSFVDGKMSKSRCVKLLESYRAEREKVKKGRKFERCLCDSVVDEALERAIELLSEKS